MEEEIKKLRAALQTYETEHSKIQTENESLKSQCDRIQATLNADNQKLQE
jgi:chromosome segregation ATPase